MTPADEFWWNWWVQLGVAVGTLLAAFVALFGNRLRAALFKPILEVSFPNPRGKLTTLTLNTPSGESRQEACRFYHLLVKNRAPWPPATGVQLFLIRMEEFGPDQTPHVKWTGEVPMRWCMQEVHPLARTIGSPATCDFFTVVKDKWLELQCLVVPNDLQARRRERTDVIVSFQARSNEGQSHVLRVRISWDGQWADGEVEMSHHVTDQSTKYLTRALPCHGET